MKLLISLFIFSSVAFGQVDSNLSTVAKMYFENVDKFVEQYKEYAKDEQIGMTALGDTEEIKLIQFRLDVIEKIFEEYNRRIEQLEARIKELEDNVNYSDSIWLAPDFYDPMFILPYDYYQQSLKNIKLE